MNVHEIRITPRMYACEDKCSRHANPPSEVNQNISGSYGPAELTSYSLTHDVNQLELMTPRINQIPLYFDWPFKFTSHPRNPGIRLVFLPLVQVVDRISESGPLGRSLVCILIRGLKPT